MLTPKKIGKCFYQALVDTINHDGIEHAGYLAFLAILSIFPFIVFFFAIAGFLGQTEVGLKLIHIILENKLIPQSILAGLEPRIKEIESGPPQGLLTLSILGSIWTASSMVEGLRTILNRAYRVGTPPAYIWRRMMSILQYLIIIAVSIFAVFVLILGPKIWEDLKDLLQLEKLDYFLTIQNIRFSPAWHWARYFITSVTLFLAVSTSYFIIPNIKQSWKSVSPGAVVVVVLWFISGSLFSSYLSNFHQVHVIYGSLGSLIASMLFFYITAMIFVYGAEFNYLLEKALGHTIEEKEYVEVKPNQNID